MAFKCFSRTFAKAAALVEAWLPEETHKCRLPRHSVQYWMWKAKAGHQSQKSAPISLSLEAGTSNSTTASRLHFLTLCTHTKLDAHSKTFVHKLFSCNNRRSGHRPVPQCEQKWSCHTVTQTKASQEDVYAPGTTPSLLADLVLGRRRLSLGTAGAVVSLLIINMEVTQITAGTHYKGERKKEKETATTVATGLSCAHCSQYSSVHCWSDGMWEMPIYDFEKIQLGISGYARLCGRT